jgi:hypothetical protein
MPIRTVATPTKRCFDLKAGTIVSLQDTMIVTPSNLMMKRILLLILTATMVALLGGCIFPGDRDDRGHRDHDDEHHDSDHHDYDHH